MKKDDLESLNLLLKSRDPKLDAFNKMNGWKEQYYEELLDYKYIHSLDEFIKLRKGGIIKIISMKNEILKKGGIILDIKKNNKNKYYALVGITNRNILWKIYFDDNYIFFREQYSIYKNNQSSDNFKHFISKFIPQTDSNEYEFENRPNKNVEYLLKEYSKNI
jgi:hypothetical protein